MKLSTAESPTFSSWCWTDTVKLYCCSGQNPFFQLSVQHIYIFFGLKIILILTNTTIQNFCFLGIYPHGFGENIHLGSLDELKLFSFFFPFDKFSSADNIAISLAIDVIFVLLKRIYIPTEACIITVQSHFHLPT